MFVKVLLEKKGAEAIKLPDSFLHSSWPSPSLSLVVCREYLEKRIIHSSSQPAATQTTPPPSTVSESTASESSAQVTEVPAMSAEDLRTLETVMRDQVDDMLADILEERRRTVAMVSGSDSDSEDSFDEKYLPRSSGSGEGMEKKEKKEKDMDGDEDEEDIEKDIEKDIEEDIEKDIEEDIDNNTDNNTDNNVDINTSIDNNNNTNTNTNIDDNTNDNTNDNTTTQSTDEEERRRNMDIKLTCEQETAEKPAESRFIHMNQEDIRAILGMSMESIMGEEELENLTNAFAKEVAEKPAAAPEEKKETKSGFWCR